MSEKELNNTINSFNPWWKGEKLELGLIRDEYLQNITQKITEKKILFLVGSRRVGKTVLLFQTINKLIEDGINSKKILFLSLDNINFKEFNIYKYILDNDFEYLFLDEIQNYQKWEQILKSIFDLPTKKHKIVCSGSSYKAINSQKGLLTGRNSLMEMYPLNYKEFKTFEKELLEVTHYLELGGYPEYILEKNPNYLSELLKDIVNKDIVDTYKIRNKEIIFDILRILAKQIGSKSSNQKLSKTVGSSDDTVKAYISYLNEVRILESLSKYSESPKDIIYSQKKHYFLDTGMRNALVGFEDIGALVENAVFIKLLTTYKKEDIYYLQNNRGDEVDFLIKLDNHKCILIESKYKSFEEGIKDKLSTLFLKEEIYNLEVVERVVITNGLTTEISIKDQNIKLIALEEFL